MIISRIRLGIGLSNIRKTFTAIFSRYGTWRNWNGDDVRTYLFKGVKDKEGSIITDSLWIKEGKNISKLGELKEGDVIQFEARLDIDEKTSHIKVLEDGSYQENNYIFKNPSKFQKLPETRESIY